MHGEEHISVLRILEFSVLFFRSFASSLKIQSIRSTWLILRHSGCTLDKTVLLHRIYTAILEAHQVVKEELIHAINMAMTTKPTTTDLNETVLLQINILLLLLGVAHGALLMSTRGDTSQITLEELMHVAGGGSARIKR